MFRHDTATQSFFRRATARPALVVVLASLLVCLCLAGLARLIKDSSVTAFMPANHPSLIADERIAATFGLLDPIAVAILATDDAPLFTPSRLTLIDKLTDEIAALPNVRGERVASLATESSISGVSGMIDVEPYIGEPPLSDADAAASFERWRAMPAHRGTLVSHDAKGAVIMAELVDSSRADDTYAAVMRLASQLREPGVEMHVAGPGAVSGFLAEYIDQDARTLQPIVVLLVLGFIFLAFRRFRALPGPLLVVAGTSAGALGLMALAGGRYFAITNALPVVLVAIAVADAIHVLSAFYRYREQDTSADTRDIVVAAMVVMSRPITLTTLTTIAGFAGIAAASIMPPVTWFAVFAGVGVGLAWVFSILVLPNMLILIDPGRSPAFAVRAGERSGRIGNVLGRLGSFAARHHLSVLLLFGAIVVVAAVGASKLTVDRSQVENFAAAEPIRIADETLNARFAGTAFLDVIVDSDQDEGLLDPARMRKILALQRYFESLPHVQKTVSIVDYLSSLHHALQGLPDRGLRQLPDAEDAVAQYLLVYEASGDPDDFAEEINPYYETALVRGILNAHYFSETRGTVEALQRYIDTEFNEPGLVAVLAGDVNIGYHWMRSLADSHFRGVALSLALVLAGSALAFRSAATGFIAVVPVAFAVLALYACMGYLGIYLEPATSMFAAIALGVGVDFAIHLVAALRLATARFDGDVFQAIDAALPAVARACFFNAAALGFGFAVLLISDLPTLQRFGGLVALAAFSSFAAALIFVPALFAAAAERSRRSMRWGGWARTTTMLLLVAAIAGPGTVVAAEASDMRAERIARAVADRPEGSAARRIVEITLTDRRGRSRERAAIVHRVNSGDSRLTRFTYLEPKRLRDVAFLSHDDLASSETDNRWLYLPATRKARRIPAAERGKNFQGTDFSYEDIQSPFKFAIADYDFDYLGTVRQERRVRHRIAGTPVSPRTARELGYGRIEALVDEESWMPLEIVFFDTRLDPLKTVTVQAFERIDDVWTATDIVARNQQTGHETRFVYRDVSYPSALPDGIFEPHALNRGLPASEGD